MARRQLISHILYSISASTTREILYTAVSMASTLARLTAETVWQPAGTVHSKVREWLALHQQ